MNELAENGWLLVNGQRVTLAAEEVVLADSRAIEALFIAAELVDDDDRSSPSLWFQICEKRLNVSRERYSDFLNDYERCGYLVALDNHQNMAQLNIQSINRDYFYLKQAQRAKLRRRRAVTL